MSFVLITLGLLLDQLFGEPKRYHPLVGFGNIANRFEISLNSDPSSPNSIILGLISLTILVLPLAIVSHFIALSLGQYSWVFTLLIIYFAIGLKSLIQHSTAVANALKCGDLENARYSISMMVSRDTEYITETETASAAIESTLENGCDSTYGVLFWYLVGGVPMVIVYRLTNTLDAMWGYQNQRFNLFGRSAAKLDDVLNYLPARFTALSYALCDNTKGAVSSWRHHSRLLASPNGGPVMTSGAGALGTKLGGPAHYHGALYNKPYFGGTKSPVGNDILRANLLVIRSTLLWCFVIFAISMTALLFGDVS